MVPGLDYYEVLGLTRCACCHRLGMRSLSTLLRGGGTHRLCVCGLAMIAPADDRPPLLAGCRNADNLAVRRA
jgi:hypothetical protein